MIINFSDKAKDTLLHLFNKSWEKKECPKEWKTAEIITIPKPGKDHSLTTSYRPISLLSCISKLMERMVQARLQDFLERNNLLHPSQAGFRKGRSTNEQITRLTQHLVDGLQRRERSITVYVDFTKAYDKVWRDNLWGKMGKMGIPTCVVRWVKSLLSDRYATVRYNNNNSNKKRFDNGLPQGSVLAPLLWLIYINDLPEALNKVSNVQLGTSESLFADDVSLTTSARTMKECEKAMQPILNALEKWSEENKVTISINSSDKSKTVCCLYTRDPAENGGKLKPNLTLAGIKIHHTTTPKFLGVIIDQQLNFKAQAEATATKAGKRNRILKSLSGRSWGQKSRHLRNLHCAYTQAAIDHGIGAWGPMAAPSNIDKVAKKEREAARTITGCVRDTTKDTLICEAGLQPITTRITLQATLQHERSTRLPPEVPAHKTATEYVPLRLKKRGAPDPIMKDKLLPPRETAWKTLCKAKIECTPKETTILYPEIEPWNWETADYSNVNFSTSLDGCMGKNDTQTNIVKAASGMYDKFLEDDIICYTDGSVNDGTRNGGAGACINIPGEDKVTLRRACGIICSSFRAEMMAIEEALNYIHNNNNTIKTHRPAGKTKRTIWIITDSQSAITTLQQGPGNQYSKTGNTIWRIIIELSRMYNMKFQWIPGHKEIEGNEEADKIAGEATTLPQDEVPIDFITAKAAIKRHLYEENIKKLESADTFHQKATNSRPKPLPKDLSRRDEVIIHQLRTGKSPIAANCLYKYRGLTEDKGKCLAGCGEKETVEHLLTCVIYDKQRLEVCGDKDIIKLLNDNPVEVLSYLDKIGRRAIPDL